MPTPKRKLAPPLLKVVYVGKLSGIEKTYSRRIDWCNGFLAQASDSYLLLRSNRLSKGHYYPNSIDTYNSDPCSSLCTPLTSVPTIQLGMRESGYSLSPLYLKPLLIVGRSVCVSVCVCVRRYLECLYIFSILT